MAEWLSGPRCSRKASAANIERLGIEQDFQRGALMRGSPQDQLDGEPRADAIAGGEVDARDGLEDGALAGALVSHDDDLGLVDKEDAQVVEAGDGAQQTPRLFAVERFRRHDCLCLL